MSIWSSCAAIGWDGWPEPDEPQPAGGDVRAYAHGFSNHYPLWDDITEAPAELSLASIAPWCVPGWYDDANSLDYPQCGPWLRLSMDSPRALTWWPKDGQSPTPEPIHADVVMDEPAVRALVADLNAWLARPKVHPKGPA